VAGPTSPRIRTDPDRDRGHVGPLRPVPWLAGVFRSVSSAGRSQAHPRSRGTGGGRKRRIGIAARGSTGSGSRATISTLCHYGSTGSGSRRASSKRCCQQQSLALEAAAEAIADAGWDDHEGLRLRAGVFVGVGLDLNTTNFHLRWRMPEKARAWNRRLGLRLARRQAGELDRRIARRGPPRAVSEPNDGGAGRTGRQSIAREFRLGGPSFTVSSEETSGAHALDIAVRLLRQGELDQASRRRGRSGWATYRAVLATHRVPTVLLLGGRAAAWRRGRRHNSRRRARAALVLKRLDDAVRERRPDLRRGPRIGVASGPDPSDYLAALRRGYSEAAVVPASVGYLEAHGSGCPDEDRREATALAEFGRQWPVAATAPAACALGSSKADVGHTGAGGGRGAGPVW